MSSPATQSGEDRPYREEMLEAWQRFCWTSGGSFFAVKHRWRTTAIRGGRANFVLPGLCRIAKTRPCEVERMIKIAGGTQWHHETQYLGMKGTSS